MASKTQPKSSRATAEQLQKIADILSEENWRTTISG